MSSCHDAALADAAAPLQRRAQANAPAALYWLRPVLFDSGYHE